MEPLQKDEQGNAILPQPDEMPDSDRELAAGSYIMMFAGQYLPLPLGNLIAAFIYHMVCRKRARFIAFHSYQSLVSQIPTSLAMWGVIAWIIWQAIVLHPQNPGEIFTTTLLVLIAVVTIWSLLYTILSLVAYRRARTGRLFYLPLFGKMTFARYFGPNALPATPDKSKVNPNRPPGL
jgi:uncharacterized Tic20 family protein